MKLFSILCCLLFSSCAIQKTAQNTCGDPDRPLPLLMPLNTVVSGSLSPVLGDDTDWKHLTIESEDVTAIVVRVYWDDPEKIHDAVITIHDKYGVLIAERAHDPLATFDEILVTVDENEYFLRLKASAGCSPYLAKAKALTYEIKPPKSYQDWAVTIEVKGLGPPEKKSWWAHRPVTRSTSKHRWGQDKN